MAKTKRFPHRRVIWPMPNGSVWTMGCECGWKGEERLVDHPRDTARSVMDALNEQFRAHLPADERFAYVKVDSRVELLGAWVMPDGVPCQYGNWRKVGGEYVVDVIGPHACTLPVGEVISPEGRIFRLE